MDSRELRMYAQMGFLASCGQAGTVFFRSEEIPFGPQGPEDDYLAVRLRIGARVMVIRILPEPFDAEVVMDYFVMSSDSQTVVSPWDVS
jgi:hypothetical protein